MSEQQERIEKFGWWGDEGGHRLDFELMPDGRLKVTATTDDQPPAVVTLANFRTPQLAAKIAPVADHNARLRATDAAQEGEWKHVDLGQYKDVWIESPDGRRFLLACEPDFANLAHEINTLTVQLRAAQEERDSIQHQEIHAAQVEYNAMRDRAIAAEARVTELQAQLEPFLTEMRKVGLNWFDKEAGVEHFWTAADLVAHHRNNVGAGLAMSRLTVKLLQDRMKELQAQVKALLPKAALADELCGDGEDEKWSDSDHHGEYCRWCDGFVTADTRPLRVKHREDCPKARYDALTPTTSEQPAEDTRDEVPDVLEDGD